MSLWLDHEPSFEEVAAAFETKNMDEYEEVVFCGFGEPTEAFDVLVQVADYVKTTFNKPIRLNTNGLGSLVNERDITPELQGRIDIILTKEEETQCAKIGEDLGVTYRIRPFEE